MKAPESLELRAFLDAVAERVLVEGKSVLLDFSETEQLHVAGAILMYAELDRVIAQSDLEKPVTLIHPRRRRSREVLKQIGLYEVAGDKCDTIPSREDVVHWKTAKGRDQSGERIAMLGVVTEEYKTQLTIASLWRGVSEAVANSVEHAYKKPRKDGFMGLPETKWWMFTQVRDGYFTVAVCDLGCGYRATIGETLPERFVSQLAETFAQLNKDARAIHTAMEYGRSGTQEEHRGKGSRDAMSVLERHKGGDLMIMSNTGWMRYVFQDGKLSERHNGSLGTSINGTIIWWKLPL